MLSSFPRLDTLCVSTIVSFTASITLKAAASFVPLLFTVASIALGMSTMILDGGVMFPGFRSGFSTSADAAVTIPAKSTIVNTKIADILLLL